jgi:hypothetical protein
MRKGQTGIALVILGVVAIIAVIGLVLLFTRASKTQGALLTDFSVGNSYGAGQNQGGYGVGSTIPVPEYYRIQNYQQPLYTDKPTADYTKAGLVTQGSRTPAFIATAGEGYPSLDEARACVTDLHVGAHILAPADTFNFYQVPEETGSPEVVGFYPGDSSAQGRITAGNPLGNAGGLTLAYANSFGAEGQVANSEDLVGERIVLAIKANGGKLGYHDWGIITVNGKERGLCYISSRQFPFPQ